MRPISGKIFDTSNDHYFCVLYQKLFSDPMLILRDGTTFSKNQYSEKYTFFDYYQDLYPGTYVEKIRKPHMIYTGVGNIPQLESLKLDIETIKRLNQEGLEIYLYEILSFGEGTVDKFYVDSINYHKSNKSAKEVLKEKKNSENIFCYEFESIKQFIKNNQLINVSVYTCDYYSREKLSGRYPEFKIFCKDIFIQSLFNENTDPIRINFNVEEIKYKFWSANWRYTSYRNIIAAYLCQRSSLISWNYKISNLDLLKELWFDLEYKKEEILSGNDYLNRHGPFSIDLPGESINVDTDQINKPSIKSPDWTHRLPVDFYARCFCSVVTESRFTQDTATFSEKTINSIRTMRPFILVAPPRTLEYLKKLGFKTFDEFWDESYDQEVDHKRRLEKILNLIDYVNNYNLEELKVLYEKMFPILNHNLKVLSTFKSNEIIL
jgi:hypothetical protein